MYKVPEEVLKECRDTIEKLITTLSNYNEKFNELNSVQDANNTLKLLKDNYGI